MDKLIQDLDIIDNESQENCEVKISKEENSVSGRKLYIESYGCQMNFSDSEIVTSILADEGFSTTSDASAADVIFLNTCSIREKAELTVRNRLSQLNSMKRTKPDMIIGVLGCMAERLKTQLLEEEQVVDLVAGPDSYRDLPSLVKQVDDGGKAVNTLLSREETYGDINPVRLNSNGVTAFISIMRGCDNVCSFCVVPFTRGRERSRDPESIVNEARELFNRGFREVTLLGQNVDSYKWSAHENNKAKLNKLKDAKIVNFAGLLERIAKIDTKLRVRFSTSHPKDITNEVLHVIVKYDNICNYVHLPAQSGNSRILELMNRTYDREWYLERISAIREIIGDDCGISSDMITGFCSETDEEHKETLSLMDLVHYDFAYMFYYSERPGTMAARRFEDDIPLEVKKRRLSEIIEKQREHSLLRNKRDLGKVQQILIEGYSKRSEDYLQGRNSANKVVIIPKSTFTKGDYVDVLIEECTAATLIGKPVKL